MYPFLGAMMLAGEDGPLTVWNQADRGGYAASFSADGATITSGYDEANAGERVRARNPRSGGQHYFEILVNVPFNTNGAYVGLARTDLNLVNNGPYGDSNRSCVLRVNFERQTSLLFDNQVYGGAGSAIDATTVLQFAVDLTAGALFFGRDGVWRRGDPVAGTGGVSIGTGLTWAPCGFPLPGCSATIGGSVYAPPAGFSPWI